MPNSFFNLTPLGYKIFLDRYSLKHHGNILKTGDTVLYRDKNTHQKEIGVVGAVEDHGDCLVEVINEHGNSFHRRDELDAPLETVEQTFQRVAKAAAQGDADLEREFNGLFERGEFVPAGRILESLGSGSETSSNNCYVLPSPKDSRAGIFKTLADMAECMCKGGGVGINYSSLRPSNAYVAGVNGRSSGAVSWSELFSFTTNLISQGGSRRGASMNILCDWHPDIFDFIKLKQDNTRATGCNMSVAVSDAFMQAVKDDADWQLKFPDTSHPRYDTLWDGDIDKWVADNGPIVVWRTIKARELWNAIIESAHKCAEPGVWFKDTSNKARPGGDQHICTNPCMPSWATVLTPQGISTFADTEVGSIIWSGAAWTTVVAKHYTGIKPVYGYKTRAGIFYGTANHNVFSNGVKTPAALAQTIDVCVGTTTSDPLNSQDVLDGVVFGDGTNHRGSGQVLLYVGANDKEEYKRSEIAEYIGRVVDSAESNSYCKHALNLTTITLEELPRTYDRVVPTRFYYGTPTKVRGFLRGLYSANGSVVSAGGSRRVTLKAASFQVISAVQDMLSSIGILSYYTTNKSHRVTFANGDYLCKESYDLNIGYTEGRRRFSELVGFIHSYKTEALLATLECKPSCKPTRSTYEVIEVEEFGEQPVYSITVDDPKHRYWTGGLLVANCGEIPLPGNSVCNLGHIFLPAFVVQNVWNSKHQQSGGINVDWRALDYAVASGVRFLDSIIDVMNYPLPQIKERQLQERRVGLGTLGLGEMLIRLGLRYGSDKAVAFCGQLYKRIAVAAYRTSYNLGKRKGVCKVWDHVTFQNSVFGDRLGPYIDVAGGVRNICLLTAAPTGTVGSMLNTSTGIEPFFAWEWERKGRLGSHMESVKVLQEYRQRSASTPDTTLPDYFVSAMELTPEEHVKMQAAIQKWTDNSISKTTNVPNHYTIEQVGEVYKLLYESGCKGGTAYRDGCRDVQVLNLIPPKEPVVVEATPANTTAVTPEQYQKYKATLATTTYPAVRPSVTSSKKTPSGAVHVTLTYDPATGAPLEVFCEAGRSGSEVKALMEAMGRIATLVLRVNAETPQQRLQLLIAQLRGIGGNSSVGFGLERILSIPDGIGNALNAAYSYYNTQQTAVHPIAELVEDMQLHTGLDICPSCQNLSLQMGGGCCSCNSCGFSRC